MRLVVLLLSALAVAAAASPAEPDVEVPAGLSAGEELQDPSELALLLGEEEFEDYLDAWLAVEEPKWALAAANVSQAQPRNGCTFRVRGDLGQPQPVYLRGGTYIVPTGNTGLIHVPAGQQVTVACTGSGRTIQHPNVASTLAIGTVSCANSDLVTASWLRGNSAFGGLVCSAHPFHDAHGTAARCWNNNLVIQIGFIVSNVFHPLYWSCFDQSRLEVLYTWYEQNPPHAIHQTGVDRPSFLAGSFFPGVNINNLYTQVTQRATIAGLVGPALADTYVTSTQFLARGHLAAKSDFIFATGQRASFYFVNAAPQWQPFNAGNWNSLEQNLRARVGAAGYHTTVYTGTFGVSQLRDQAGRLVDIFLHRGANNAPQLPVPLYFYKVVHDASRRIATAFVSINNPYYTLAEARALTFCTDRCRGNSAFSWLRWQPDRIDIGYSFCCELSDFRRTVPHLPAFTVTGLLT